MDTMQPPLKPIIEALLLVADRPLTLKDFAELLPEFSRKAVKSTLKDLQQEYSDSQRGFEVTETAAGFRLQTHRDLRSWVLRLKKTTPLRLSKAALEVLAVTAYKQPVTRAEIENIRGVDSSGTLRFLLDRKLLRIAGRKDVPGRPLLYATTKKFLDIFGLKNLSCLPSEAEISELGPAEDGLQQLPLFRKSNRRPA